jgi:hypothetical protein
VEYGPFPQRSHSQGLATLSAVLATRSLENLFQFSMLLGFALQSISPLWWLKTCFQVIRRSCTFLQNHMDLASVLQRFDLTKKPRLLLQPECLVQVEAFALLSFMVFRASPSADPCWDRLHPNITLSFFEPHDFAATRPRNPRGCSVSGLAISLRRGRRPV